MPDRIISHFRINCNALNPVNVFIRFIHHSQVSRIEIKLQRFREIPSQTIYPVPRESFIIPCLKYGIRKTVIPSTEFSIHDGAESEAAGYRVKIEIRQEFQPTAFR